MGAPMRGLAGTAIIVILIGITACGGQGSTTTTTNPLPSASSTAASSTAASSAATSSPAAPASATGGTPAGDHRIGGTTQGISIEVPASFTEIRLGSSVPEIKAALSKLGLSATAQATVDQYLPNMKKLNAAVAVDTESATTAPGHFATIINAFCAADGANQAGSAAVAGIKQAAVSEFKQAFGATNVTATDKVIGGIPGVEVTYQQSSATVGTIDTGQLEVAVKPGKACFVTLTAAAGQFSNAILSEAAASAQFP